MTSDEIDGHMAFYTRRELKERKGGKLDDDDLEIEIRDVNEYERDLLKQFDANDNEIDEMLEQVINQIDGLKIHAENIGTAIENQKEIIKKLNSKAEKARNNL
jgi:hypothetical protein